MKSEYARAGAHKVGDPVRDLGRATSNELLVKFIQRTEPGDCNENQNRCPRRRVSDTAQREPRQHGIHAGVNHLVCAARRYGRERARERNGCGDENKRGPAEGRAEALKSLTQSSCRLVVRAA